MSEFPDWPEWRYSPYDDHSEAERNEAEARVEATDSADGMLALLRGHSMLLRERAAAHLGYRRPEGAPTFMEQVLESDPEPIFDQLRREPNSWVYNSLLISVCDVADELTPDTSRRVSEVVRELAARGEPSSRRWLTWQAIFSMDRRKFVKPWLEGLAKDRLLSEPENSIRYKLAEQIFGVGHRVPAGLLEFTNQWARHVGYKTGYGPPEGGKWAPKDRSYFAGESRPLLAPKAPPTRRSAPPGASSGAARSAGHGQAGHAAPPAYAAPPAPAQGHVSIEHTKKSIKAQGVLARVLMVAGFVMPFTRLENRFVLAGVMIVGAFLWLQWLKVRRWWEHG